jgi:hypothetical protein
VQSQREINEKNKINGKMMATRGGKRKFPKEISTRRRYRDQAEPRCQRKTLKLSLSGYDSFMSVL